MLKSRSIRSRAATGSSWRRPSISRAMARARSEASPGSARAPDSSSRTSSGIPERRLAITGRPLAIASISATGMPSWRPSAAVRLGRTKASASPRRSATSGSGRFPWKRIATLDPEVPGERSQLGLQLAGADQVELDPAPSLAALRREPRAAPGGPCSPGGWRRRAGAPAPARAAGVDRTDTRRGRSRSGRPRSAAARRSGRASGSAGCTRRSSPRSSRSSILAPRKHCWTKMSWAWAVKL